MTRDEPLRGAIRGGAWVILLAVSLRSGWAIAQSARHGSELPFPDEVLHWQLATNLVERGDLVTDDGRRAARMPVYPLWLAIFAAWDHGVIAARLGQAFLGGLCAWLAWRFARDSWGPRAGAAAGALVAIDPYSVFFSSLLLTETPFTLSAVALVIATIHLATAAPGATVRHGPWTLVAAGCGTLAFMTRPSAVLWVAWLWLIAVASARGTRGKTRRAVVILVVAAMPMLAWGVRNHSVLGAFAWLSANGGVTLYDAVGPQADGSSDQSFLEELRSRRGLAGLGEVEFDRAVGALAWQEVGSDPARIAELGWIKLRRTWSLLPNEASHRQTIAGYAGAGFTLLVMGGAMLAAIRATRRTSTRAAILLLLSPVLYFSALHSLYIGSVRYRVPLMPFLALASAACLAKHETIDAAPATPADRGPAS